MNKTKYSDTLRTWVISSLGDMSDPIGGWGGAISASARLLEKTKNIKTIPKMKNRFHFIVKSLRLL